MLKKLLSAINDCAWAYNQNAQKYVFISPNIQSNLGITAEALSADKELWQNMILADDRRLISEAEPDLDEWAQIYYRVSTNDEIKWIFEKRTRFLDTDTNDEIVLSVIKDVTDQNTVNYNLNNSLGDFRILFDGSHNPMWIYEMPSLRIIKVNKAATEHYGYSNEEFLTMTIRDVRPKFDLAAFNEYLFRKGITRGTMHGYNTGGIWRHQNKAGEIIYAEITGYEFKYNNTSCRIIVATDVTAQVKYQQEMENRDALGKNL
ncbi:PAS domain-containing protein [Mucilaginibacter paludis]|uniref:PAS sensor protein n=1 Tax=Mucilaginibacter paludis DSM 18603 TaxID=714943 RepID=H1YG80_9SPHI|nr:PAS domain-containing protein [Mucilaginibacter paludis]EHQ27344.1 PAS sensor protein [Mucilaginibacter paludis DSM 18603]